MSQRPLPRTPGDFVGLERAARAVRARLSIMARAALAGADPSAILAAADDPPGQPFPFDDAVADISVNDALPLAELTPRPLAPGDLITLDLAARVQGWWSDASVALVLPGPGASPALQFLHAARAASAALAGRIIPGKLWSQVAGPWRESLAAAGLELVPGFAGHGIGTALHEPPRVPYADPFGGALRSEDDFTLRPGLVFTIEPVLRSRCRRWTTWIERTIAVEAIGNRVFGGWPGGGWDDSGRIHA